MCVGLLLGHKGKEISQSLDINILLIIGEIIFTFFEIFQCSSFESSWHGVWL